MAFLRQERLEFRKAAIQRGNVKMLCEPNVAIRVSSVVAAVMRNYGLSAPKDDSDDLFVAGLTSMAMVALMLAIEGEFNITIPTADLIPTNFRSTLSLQCLIEKLHPLD